MGRWGLRAAVWVVCGAGMAAAQQAVPVVVKAPEVKQEPLKEISRAEYRAELERLEGLVTACSEDAGRCDPGAVGPDESVDKGSFEARWDWLRGALEHGRDARAKDRSEVLQVALGRLEEDASEAAGAAAVGTSLAQARGKATEILSRREFRRVEQDPWWSRQLARAYSFIDRAFSGLTEMLPQPKWMSAALEWGLLVLAAAGLMLWAWRMNKQQRIALVEARGGAGEAWVKESEDWAERARAEAARGDWREAVHCLYWSAIVMLEGQRLWRQNRARTPREYVGLLEPGSEKQKALGGLTRVFERIWYGLRPAAESDYRSAAAMLDELRAR